MKTQEILLPFDALSLPQRSLYAGALNCLYEAGNLRSIRFGHTEILLMMYLAVRDENWNTIIPEISKENIVEKKDHFQISYIALYQSGSARYKASVNIEGNAEGKISFSVKGEALTGFIKNRIGLCTHHTVSALAGKQISIIHTSGDIEASKFPLLISPHQPFMDIREMQWSPDEAISATLSFSGDVFETEDQRNWTDNSYKTYSTPLSIPYPVGMAAGDKMVQEAVLSVSGSPGKELPKKESPTREERVNFPRIGYNRAETNTALTEKEIEWAKRIPFDYYRTLIDTGTSDWKDKLALVMEEATSLGVLLELSVVFDENNQTTIDDFVVYIHDTGRMIGSILPLEKTKRLTSPGLLEKVYQPLKTADPTIKIGYGAAGNFSDLNRNRPVGIDYDFISFTVHPQVHASDTVSIWNNLNNQSDLITTVRDFAAEKPIDVAPIQFAKAEDNRQQTYFTALWTLLTLQNLAEARCVILHDLCGTNGLLMNKGEHAPLYNLLAELREFNPCHIIRQYQGSVLLTDVFCVENEHGERLSFRFSDH